MSQRPPRTGQHEGVVIDNIAEERLRRAQALEGDFLGSRNIPSTGLRIPEPAQDSNPPPSDKKDVKEDAEEGKEEAKS